MRKDSARQFPLVCLLGATGTGKTAAAILIAREAGGEVINFDSRQIYRDLPIVTAQPTSLERSVCPHLLYGFAAVADSISAGQFARLLAGEVAKVRARGHIPILTGGSGLYLRAFLHGLAEIPDIPDSLRRKLAGECLALGPQALHARLAAVDPAYAGRIAPADRQRVTRALEVYEATGKPLSAWHAEQVPPEPGRAGAIKAGLGSGLDDLTPRLMRRIKEMLAAGALAEVRNAFAANPDARLPGFSGIGCPEILAHLRGELTHERCEALWLKNTRAYAKRQMTWFKKEPDAAWFGLEQARELSAHVVRELDNLRKSNGKTP